MGNAVRCTLQWHAMQPCAARLQSLLHVVRSSATVLARVHPQVLPLKVYTTFQSPQGNKTHKIGSFLCYLVAPGTSQPPVMAVPIQSQTLMVRYGAQGVVGQQRICLHCVVSFH